MRRNNRTVLLLGLGIAGNAIAQNPGTLNVDLADCIGLESDAARFACYEERVSAELAKRNPPIAIQSIEPPNEPPEPEIATAPDPTPEPLPEARPAVAEDSVTINAAPDVSADDAIQDQDTTSAAVNNNSRDQPEEPGPDEIFGTITGLRQTIPNSFVITLDNGQVWQQVRPKRYLLRVGLEVRLYPTRWGSSYRLTALDSGSFIQVRRVR